MEIFSLIASLIMGWLGQAHSDELNAQALEAQKQLQDDAQDFTHNERVETEVYQQQMHEHNLLNDPSLQMQGLVNAGVSRAAAAQAIAGAPSTGWSPTASNVGSGIASVPPMNSYSPGFKNMADAFNEYFNNLNKSADTREKDQNIVYSKQMVEESISRMTKMANDMKIDNEQLEIAKLLANSTIGLNQSQIDLNYGKLDEVNTNITRMFAEIENLDAQTIESYVRSSMYKAQTANYIADTTLKNAQVEYVNAQTEGQNIENLDKNITLTLKNARLEISKALGVDIDSSETTQILMAMAQGRFDTIQKLIENKNVEGTGIIPNIHRNGLTRIISKTRKNEKSYLTDGVTPSLSFQPLWNPFN